MRKYRRIVFLVSVVSLLVIFVVEINRTGTMSKDMRAASDNRLPTTRGISNEDSALISPKYIGRIRSYKNFNSGERDPVSFLFVDSCYHLIIFKIHMETDRPLPEIIGSDNKNSQRSDCETYTGVDLNGISRFEWRPWPAKQTRNIFLSVYGDSLSNEILNDSLAAYRLLCKNLSIKYAKNGVVQVLLTCGKITPADLLFLRRGKTVYFMLMTAFESKSFIPREILYDLVTGM